MGRKHTHTHTCWAFYFIFLFFIFVRKNRSSCDDIETQITSQRQQVSRLPAEPPRRPAVCMYVNTYSKSLWINRVRFTWSAEQGKNISLSAFAHENLVSPDGFRSPVPRQPAHLHMQAESGAYLRDSSRVPRRRPFIYLKTPMRHRVSPKYIGSRNCVPMAFTAESLPAQGQ